MRCLFGFLNIWLLYCKLDAFLNNRYTFKQLRNWKYYRHIQSFLQKQLNNYHRKKTTWFNTNELVKFSYHIAQYSDFMMNKMCTLTAHSTILIWNLGSDNDNTLCATHPIIPNFCSYIMFEFLIVVIIYGINNIPIYNLSWIKVESIVYSFVYAHIHAL